MLSSSSSSWRCISQNWHQSAEGQGVIAHLTDPDSGTRKLYGQSANLASCVQT